MTSGEVTFERKQATGAEETGDLGYRAVRISPGHGAVVGEDDVEAGVRQRNALGGGVDQWEIEASGCHGAAGILELTRRVVESDGPCAAAGQADGPLRGAAAELEHVPVRDVAQCAELRFGDAPCAPGAGLGLELRRVPGLVLVAPGIPRDSVALKVLGLAHD
jgi:hypothetical protein